MCRVKWAIRLTLQCTGNSQVKVWRSLTFAFYDKVHLDYDAAKARRFHIILVGGEDQLTRFQIQMNPSTSTSVFMKRKKTTFAPSLQIR